MKAIQLDIRSNFSLGIRDSVARVLETMTVFDTDQISTRVFEVFKKRPVKIF